jgi:hypothetical protein
VTTNRLASGDFPMKAGPQVLAQVNAVEEVLRDVYDLLKLYGPPWYSERLHQRIKFVLSHSDDTRKRV